MASNIQSRHHSAEIIPFPMRQAEPEWSFCTKPGPCPCADPCHPSGFHELGAPTPAQPPRLPYKPPANSPPRRKPTKAADGAQASPQPTPAASHPVPEARILGAAQPDIHLMEKARLLAQLAESFGVDLRLVQEVARQRQGATEQPDSDPWRNLGRAIARAAMED